MNLLRIWSVLLLSAKRVGHFVGAICLTLAQLVHHLLGLLLQKGRKPTSATAFKEVQSLINHVAHRDEHVCQLLDNALDVMPTIEKDRLILVLVMTLRVEAKKTLIRKRAIAVLAYRLNTVGERLYKLDI